MQLQTNRVVQTNGAVIVGNGGKGFATATYCMAEMPVESPD